jgi:hypothetical protein
MKRILHGCLLAGLLSTFIVVQAAIFICPRCSYEQPEGAVTCNHCGTALPRPPAPSPAPTATPPTPTVWLATADDNWRKASDAAEQGKLWLAWFYARNAHTLNRMVEATNSTRNVRLVGLLRTLEKHLRPATQPCPLCVGSGKRPRYVKMSNGSLQLIPNAKTCPRCNGARTLPARTRADTLVHNRAQAKRDYDALQQDRGWISVEDVWLSPELAANLPLPVRAQLLHIMGSPCLNCAGMGLHACTKCDGAGWIKCTRTDCVAGAMPCADCDGTGKAVTGKPSAKHGAYCRTCSSLGHVLCKTCKGNASLICPTCGGREELVCKTCNGAGQNALCGTCKGDGLLTCNRCRGSGLVKNVTCADCKGLGRGVCANCKGIGRAAKR